MGFIPEEIIRQVLDRADIIEVVSSYIPLKQAGRNFRALSPFKHEKTPSFFVSPEKQIFHCFSTGAGGNAISFVMKMERITFPEAVRLLADKYGIIIPEKTPYQKRTADLADEVRRVNDRAMKIFHRYLLTDRSQAAEDARRYLKGRGVDLDVVKIFKLGFALEEWEGLIKALRRDKVSLSVMEKAGLVLARKGGDGYYDRFRNRIIFPIFDERGRVVAFGGRAMEKDNPAKYMNSPETPAYVKGRHLYGFHVSKDAVSQEDRIVIVEGYMDFIMPYVSGFRHLAASLGTALTIEQIRLIRRYTRNVVMLYDADPAGEAAMNRSLDLLIEEGMNARIAVLPDKEDPDTHVRTHGLEAFRERVAQAKSIVDFKIDFLTDRYGRQTVEGRSKIASEILPTVARFQDPIARTEAVKTLARALSIVQGALMTEKALLTELGRLAGQSAGRNGAAQQIKPNRIKAAAVFSSAEQTLIMLMLMDTACVRLVQEENIAEAFENQELRALVEKICELFARGQGVSLPVLISECDEKTGDLLSGLMAKEESIIGNRIKICRDCIQRLRERQLRDQRRMILSEMEHAKKSGDQHRLGELTGELNRLIKGVS